jgi:hypothetical protein
LSVLKVISDVPPTRPMTFTGLDAADVGAAAAEAAGGGADPGCGEPLPIAQPRMTEPIAP